MGEWFQIGLQAGKKAAEKVDVYNKDMMCTLEGRKELKNGSVIYKWCMKWNPGLYKEEEGLIELLKGMDENDEDYAYKMVCVGEEGSQDFYSNELGSDIFDELYEDHTVVFPEPFEDKPKRNKNLPANIIDIIEDFLEEHNVSIENEERKEDDKAIIVGSHFDFLMAKITETLNNFGIKVTEDWD